MKRGKKSTTLESVNSEVESLSVMSPFGLDNSSFQFTVKKLNRKDYREWGQSIKLIVNEKGKLWYLTGGRRSLPPTNTVILHRWQLENSMVTAWMVNSMTPKIGKTYLFLPTAKDMWDVVRGMHLDSENSSKILEIKTRLWQMKQREKGDKILSWNEFYLTGIRYKTKLENERVYEFLAC